MLILVWQRWITYCGLFFPLCISPTAQFCRNRGLLSWNNVPLKLPPIVSLIAPGSLLMAALFATTREVVRTDLFTTHPQSLPGAGTLAVYTTKHCYGRCSHKSDLRGTMATLTIYAACPRKTIISSEFTTFLLTFAVRLGRNSFMECWILPSSSRSRALVQ